MGTLIKFKPLLKILAANPHTSPHIPPPTDIKQSFLLKFFLSRILTIDETVFKFLLFSLKTIFSFLFFFY